MTDTHMSASRPAGRVGDYVGDVDRKLQEVADIANEVGVSAVLHAGDIFHSPAPAFSAVVRFLNFLEKIGEARLISIPGSHDLFGNNLDSLYRTAIGFLDRVGMIELLCSATKNTTRVEPFTIGARSSRVSGIELVHDVVLPTPELVGEYTLLSDYKTMARIVIVGHYHGGYDLITVNGVTFVCPGSLVRTVAQKSEMVRRPRVAIIYNDYSVEWRTLVSAKSGSEVLQPPVVSPQIDFTGAIRAWADVKVEELDVSVLIREIARQEKISAEVVDRVFVLLEG